MNKLIDIINKKNRLIIGLMSGMSHDSLDLALAEISGDYPNLKIDLKDHHQFPYNELLKKEISELKNSSTEHISKMNFKLASYYANSINDFLKLKKINFTCIDAIGTHGQTIYHNTLNDCIDPSTLQISSGSVIAKQTGIITISNFREGDIALGGNGAPLVPYIDYLLYQNEKLPISLNNLGSISNLTVVTKNIDEVLAFDTGPANMPIDYFASQLSGNKSGYDKDGEFSAKGKIIDDLLKTWMDIPYLKLPPPKAAGYKEFGPDYLKSTIQNSNYEPLDLLRTAVEFTAKSIANAYKDFVFSKHPSLNKIVFTGGGSKNRTLINSIKIYLPNIQIACMDEKFSAAKEALAFAVLANEFLSGRPANLPNVTGASRATVLGQLSLP